MLPNNPPPNNLPTTTVKRNVTLKQILKTQEDQIQKEVDSFKQVKKLFEIANDKSDSFALIRCSQHIEAMNEVLKDIKGKVTISFFAKPGYGKSFTINNIISGFNMRYDTPLPSGVSYEKGLTSTVIDVQYGEKYKLEKLLCTHDEYLLRLKLYNKNSLQPSQFDSKDYHYNGDYEIVDSSDIDEMSSDMLKRAHFQISQFEKKKSDFDRFTVKKLILHLPSEYLRVNNIILRDMPGYDDSSNSGLYSQYIKESMEDTCILISGLENCRSILDDGIVRKYWEYGIYSPKQLFPPSVVIGINDKSQTDTAEYESKHLKNSFEVMKEKFTDQLANVFNVALEGAKLIEDTFENEETNIIEDKYSFVSGLNDNLAVLVFPPKNHKSKEFERQFSFQIEQARMKIIDKNCETLRDIAIIILTNILSKLKDNDSGSTEMQKKLLKVRESISEQLAERVEKTKTVSPTFETLMKDNPNYDTSVFITSFTDFFETGIEGCFTQSDMEDMLNKFKESRFKKEVKKKEWSEVLEKFEKDFLVIIETMKTKARDLKSELDTFVLSKSDALSNRLNEEFVNNLIRALDPQDEDVVIQDQNDEDEEEDTLIKEIYDHIVEYEDKLTEYLKDTKKIDTLNATEKEQVKKLLEEYKQKRPQSPFQQITMNSKLHNPQQAPSNLRLPTEESDNVSQLKQKDKEYVATIDPVVKLSLKKMEKSKLVMEKVDSSLIEENEIQIGFDRNNKLLISYSKKMQERCSEFEKIKKNGQDTKEKKLSEIKLAPIFLVTRPRGPWNPNLMVEDIKNLTENNVKFLFFIVTEQCYVERYKQKLGDDISKYNFLILNSDSKLGYARVETCIFQTCEHLQFQTCIIKHDDISKFYEYLPDQKVSTTHKYAMARSCLQLEDTLYEELFEPKQIKETIEKLETIITPQSLKSISITSITREVQKRNTGLSDEELDEKCLQITDYFAAFKQNDSRENALKAVAENHNQFKKFCEIACLKDLAGKIEQIFDRTKHVGRVSLYDLQTKPEIKKKVIGLSKPTHILSNSKSSVYIYYIPAMKGIHSISDEEFWKIPDDKDRKKMLKKFVPTKKNSKQNSYYKLGAKTALKGYRYSDVALKTQMLLHGVGCFQLFSFAYSSNPNAPSLNDYKDSNRGEAFNSDNEEENQTSTSSKKRKRNTTSSSSKKTKK